MIAREKRQRFPSYRSSASERILEFGNQGQLAEPPSLSMSNSTEEYPSAMSPPPSAPLRWQSWPVRDDALRALLMAIGLLALGVAVRWLSGHTHLAVLAVLAVAAAAWRFFVPVTFELGETGVDCWIFGRRRHVPWEAIRRHEVGPDGVLLFRDDARSPLAPLRGLFIPWGTHRDEVLALFRRYLPGGEGT